jgi:predicted transcriptional regulator YdeE
MKRVSVPRGRYALFTATGEMPRALIETWGKVWASPVKRAYTTDFEVHDPAKPGQVDIHIALEVTLIGPGR